jgi:hypothetical protein
MSVIAAPPRLGSREQAVQFVAEHLPSDASGLEVIVDFVASIGLRPSFMDELVKQVVVRCSADRLVLRNLRPILADTARTSAAARGVADRVAIE